MQCVPQGSILESMFFQIFTNDVCNLNLNGKLLLYADDAALYNHSTESPFLLKMQEDIVKLSSWMDFNKLTINIKKTKYTIIASPHKLYQIMSNLTPELLVDGEKLDRVTSFEYLGICLDESLMFIKALSVLSMEGR